MVLPAVYVECEPFFNMLAAAVETFKRECLGLVFGLPPTSVKNFFWVTNILPLQCTRVRKNKEVEQSKRSSQALGKFFKEAGSMYSRLGHFHSHPEWGEFKGGPNLSQADITNMASEKSVLDFLIVISSRRKGFAPWKTQENGSVAGSLGHFNFLINAYTLERDAEGQPVSKQLYIIARSALRTLNKIRRSS